MVKFEDVGIEVSLPDEEAFLKVKETLTRIGIASKKEQKLYQSCHILHKKGKYRILHFKELFALDGKPTDFSVDDRARRNAITNLLTQWNLVNLVNSVQVDEPISPINQIKILPFKEKAQWELVSKYNIGRKVGA